MIATLNGNNLMVGNMRVASISHNTKGFKWHAIFGGGRTGKKFFSTFTEAIRACAKACGLTVRIPASHEEVMFAFENGCPDPVQRLIRTAIDHIGSTSVYGEDEVLDFMANYLRDSIYVKNAALLIHRGGHHVAVCCGNDRLAIVTAEDKVL